MTAELLENRVLGALRFVDAVTSLPIDADLEVTAPGVRWIRNRRSCWVIAEAQGFDAYESSFGAAPTTPAVGARSVSLQVSDPSGHYLSRAGIVAVPRDADPAHAGQPQSLFTVIDLPLFPAPAAPIQRGWAVVYASVAGSAPGTILPGALVRVLRDSDGVRIGAGMSDARGEVLIAVEGIPSTSLGEGDGPVVATEIAARLQVVWDGAAGPIPDPDALEARSVALLVREATTRLASGRVSSMRL